MLRDGFFYATLPAADLDRARRFGVRSCTNCVHDLTPEYDEPYLKTVYGIADMGSVKAAWFRDSEGNLLGVVQVTS
jgi:hypothetical protein